MPSASSHAAGLGSARQPIPTVAHSHAEAQHSGLPPGPVAPCSCAPPDRCVVLAGPCGLCSGVLCRPGTAGPAIKADAVRAHPDVTTFYKRSAAAASRYPAHSDDDTPAAKKHRFGP